MVFVSHAQNYEDVALFRALNGVERGFYIDIGAFHPEKYSVTKAFYDLGWSGISVEPNPHLHRQIAAARPRDINLGVAIANAPGTVQLTIFEDDALSTTSRETVDSHATNHQVVDVVDVEAVSLESVWREHVPAGTDVHFLKIDMEGGEGDVIRGFDWRQRRPWILVVESTKPETEEDTSFEWEPTLLDAGYALVYNDRLNRFYVATEHDALASKLSLPPSVHDRFIPAEVNTLKSEVAVQKQRQEQAVAEISRLQAQLAHAQLALSESDERVDAMVTSTSWRVTRPLRALSRLIRLRRPTNASD